VFTIGLGDLSNDATDGTTAGAAQETVVVTLSLFVAEAAHVGRGDTLVLTVAAGYGSTPQTTATVAAEAVTVVAPVLGWTVAVSPITDAEGGGAVEVTVTVVHEEAGGANRGTAYDVAITATVPQLVDIVASVPVDAGASPNAIVLTAGALAVGATLTQTWVGKLDLAVETGSELSWTFGAGYDSAAADAGDPHPGQAGTPLTEAATVAVAAVAVGNGGDPTVTTSLDETTGQTVQSGEDVVYSVVLELPDGTTTDAAVSVVLSDGLEVGGGGAAFTVVLGADLSSDITPTAACTAAGAGTLACDFDLGALTNIASVDGNPAGFDHVTVQLTATVSSDAPLGSGSLAITASAQSLSGSVAPQPTAVAFDVVQPTLVWTDHSHPNGGRAGDAGDLVEYGVTVGAADTAAPGYGAAYNLTLTLQLSAEITAADAGAITACVSGGGSCHPAAYDGGAQRVTVEVPVLRGTETLVVACTGVLGMGVAPFVDEVPRWTGVYRSAAIPSAAVSSFTLAELELATTITEPRVATPTVVARTQAAFADPNYPARLAVGELFTLAVQVELPAGTSEFDLDVNLGDGTLVVHTGATVAYGSRISDTGAAPVLTVDGAGHLLGIFSTEVAVGDDADDGIGGEDVITVEVGLIAADGQLAPSASHQFNSGVSATLSQRNSAVVEVQSGTLLLQPVAPALAVTVTAAAGNPASPDAGDLLRFQLAVAHTTNSRSAAHAIVATLTLPANVAVVDGFAPPGGGTVNGARSSFTVEWASLATDGGTLSVEVEAVVLATMQPETAADVGAVVGWRSVPAGATGSAGTARVYVAGDLDHPAITDQAGFTTAALAVGSVTAGPGSVSDFAGGYLAGEDVPFEITVVLPEGRTEGLVVTLSLVDSSTEARTGVTYAVFTATEVSVRTVGAALSGTGLDGQAFAPPLGTSGAGAVAVSFGAVTTAPGDLGADTIVLVVKTTIDPDTVFAGLSPNALHRVLSLNADVAYAGQQTFSLAKPVEVTVVRPYHVLYPSVQRLSPRGNVVGPDLNDVDAADAMSCTPFLYMGENLQQDSANVGWGSLAAMYNATITVELAEGFTDFVVDDSYVQQCVKGGLAYTVDAAARRVVWSGLDLNYGDVNSNSQCFAARIRATVVDDVGFCQTGGCDQLRCAMRVSFQSLPSEGAGAGLGRGAVVETSKFEYASIPMPELEMVGVADGVVGRFGLEQVGTVRLKLRFPEAVADVTLRFDLLLDITIDILDVAVVLPEGAGASAEPWAGAGAKVVCDYGKRGTPLQLSLGGTTKTASFGECRPAAPAAGLWTDEVEVVVSFVGSAPALAAEAGPPAVGASAALVIGGGNAAAMAVSVIVDGAEPPTACTSDPARANRQCMVATLEGTFHAPALAATATQISPAGADAGRPSGAGEKVRYRLVIEHADGSVVAAHDLRVDVVVGVAAAGAIVAVSVDRTQYRHASNSAGGTMWWEFTEPLAVGQSITIVYEVTVIAALVLGQADLFSTAVIGYDSSSTAAGGALAGYARQVAMAPTSNALAGTVALEWTLARTSDPFTAGAEVAVHEILHFRAELTVPKAQTALKLAFELWDAEANSTTHQVTTVEVAAALGCERQAVAALGSGKAVEVDFGVCSGVGGGTVAVEWEVTIEKVATNVAGTQLSARATLLQSDGTLGAEKALGGGSIVVTVVEPDPTLGLVRVVPSLPNIMMGELAPLVYTVQLGPTFAHNTVLEVSFGGPVAVREADVAVTGVAVLSKAVVAGGAADGGGGDLVRLALASFAATDTVLVTLRPLLGANAGPMDNVTCAAVVTMDSSANPGSKSGRVTSSAGQFGTVLVWYGRFEVAMLGTDLPATASPFDLAPAETAWYQVAYTFRGAGPFAIRLSLPEVPGVGARLLELNQLAPPAVATNVSGLNVVEPLVCGSACLATPQLLAVDDDGGGNPTGWEINFGRIENLVRTREVGADDTFTATFGLTMRTDPDTFDRGASGVVGFESVFDGRTEAAESPVRLVEPVVLTVGSWVVVGNGTGQPTVVEIGAAVEFTVAVAVVASDVDDTVSTAFDLAAEFPVASHFAGPFLDVTDAANTVVLTPVGGSIGFAKAELAPGGTAPIVWTAVLNDGIDAGAVLTPQVLVSFVSFPGGTGKGYQNAATLLNAITVADLTLDFDAAAAAAGPRATDGAGRYEVSVGETIRFVAAVTVPNAVARDLTLRVVLPTALGVVGGGPTVVPPRKKDSIAEVLYTASSVQACPAGLAGDGTCPGGLKTEATTPFDTFTGETTFSITVDLLVNDVAANADRVVHDVTVVLAYGPNNATRRMQTVTRQLKVVEPELRSTLTVDPPVGDAGDVITIVHTIRHAAGSTGPASNLQTLLALPAFVTLIGNVTLASAASAQANAADAPALAVSAADGLNRVAATIAFVDPPAGGSSGLPTSAEAAATPWEAIRLVYTVRIDADVPPNTALTAGATLPRYDSVAAAGPELRSYSDLTAVSATVTSNGFYSAELALVARSGGYGHARNNTVVVGETVVIEFRLVLPEGQLAAFELAAAVPATTVLQASARAGWVDPNSTATANATAAAEEEGEGEAEEQAVEMVQTSLAAGMVFADTASSAGGVGAPWVGPTVLDDGFGASIVFGGGGSGAYSLAADGFGVSLPLGVTTNRWDNVVNGSDTVVWRLTATVLDVADNTNRRRVELEASAQATNAVAAVGLALEVVEPVLTLGVRGALVDAVDYRNYTVAHALLANRSAGAAGTGGLAFVPTGGRGGAVLQVDRATMAFEIDLQHALASGCPAEGLVVTVQMNSTGAPNTSAVLQLPSGAFAEDEVPVNEGSLYAFTPLAHGRLALGPSEQDGGGGGGGDVGSTALSYTLYTQMLAATAARDATLCVRVLVTYASPTATIGAVPQIATTRSYRREAASCVMVRQPQRSKAATGVVGSVVGSLLGVMVLGLVVVAYVQHRKNVAAAEATGFLPISQANVKAAKGLGLHPETKLDLEEIKKAEERKLARATRIEEGTDVFQQAVAFARLRYGKDKAMDAEKLAMVYKLLELPMPYNQDIGPLMAKNDSFLNREVDGANLEAERLDAVADEVRPFRPWVPLTRLGAPLAVDCPSSG
jgi:hypothetical protein